MAESTAPLLQIDDLHVRGANGGPGLLHGIDLTVHAGEVHAIMGPNGCGKSTLASCVMGSAEYVVTRGRVLLQGDDVTDWDVDVRAKAGMFLAFQHPQELPGVSVMNFLRQALSARKGVDLSVPELRLSILEWMERLGIDQSLADRHLNEGLDAAQKKGSEVLQMAILEPEVAILDETDSGLDAEARQAMAAGVREVRSDRADLGVVVISHDHRTLEELAPDRVHVMIDGRIIDSGGTEIASRLERHGYETYRDAGLQR